MRCRTVAEGVGILSVRYQRNISSSDSFPSVLYKRKTAFRFLLNIVYHVKKEILKNDCNNQSRTTRSHRNCRKRGANQDNVYRRPVKLFAALPRLRAEVRNGRLEERVITNLHSPWVQQLRAFLGGAMPTVTSDFNLWASGCYLNSVDIYSFFADRGVENAALLACEWHTQFEFGRKAPPNDVYYLTSTTGQTFERRHSVDALIINQTISDAGQTLYSAWQYHYNRILAMRNAPPVVILPPQPEPPPKPKPTPIPLPEPEPKPDEPKKETKKIFGIISSILAVAGVVAALTPIPWDNLIVKLLQTILSIFGG